MGKNILIIDDEKLVTKSLQKLLARDGYSVVIAASGIEAIEKFKNSPFDLIVSDVRMPGMDGIETIEKIRQIQKEQGKTALIPEILITGFANEESYNRALKLKVADYIFKPFDSKQFLDAIKRNLRDETEQ